MNILFIDDDYKRVQIFNSLMPRPYVHTIRHAISNDAAINFLNFNQYDVVMFDYDMTDVPGKDDNVELVIEWLKKVPERVREHLKQTVFVIHSTNADGIDYLERELKEIFPENIVKYKTSAWTSIDWLNEVAEKTFGDIKNGQ